MRLPGWITVFAVVQLVGIGCGLLSNHLLSAGGPFLWGMSFCILFPGNILGEWAVEKLFWQSSLSLTSMAVISTVLMVAINWAIWLAAVTAVGTIHARHSGRQRGA
jgi:hypothetical protein